jgi:hypothetical protein
MTDAELIARLRDAKRDWPEFGHDRAEAAARIEALTEQLTAARQDAKEAEAYAEEVEADRKKTYEALLKVSRIHGEVEAKLATCERHRDAYAECDRIGTQAVRDLEAKLAKALVINSLLTVIAILTDPNDERFTEAVDLAERFSTTLAEIKAHSDKFATQKGESHE